MVQAGTPRPLIPQFFFTMADCKILIFFSAKRNYGLKQPVLVENCQIFKSASKTIPPSNFTALLRFFMNTHG